ncbi:hypothetical protein BDB00DRAFT_910798 [Zychaea mexicana]|uniref:uncharacterized protein n=1 Tax=Zychaea mexicana TaxID=64656 RepID=UPI0022FE2E48|nr:uncharacterized protein BDB00DRAFT_910798 [Zychaea mexicana]KAI9498346.1 hypothetical protein BDB00DRAFT_910798 [Zychaea mexicana]
MLAIYVLLVAFFSHCYVSAGAMKPTYAPNISQCPKLQPTKRPENIHNLRPADIVAIAAIGDSISAGVAMINSEEDCITSESFKEYRGLSFDMGGDKGAVSLPNFISHYTPSGAVTGASKGVRQLPICEVQLTLKLSQFRESVDHFNAAIPGGTSDTMEKQIEYLLPKIGKDSPLANEWKVITIFIGQNDLSVSCYPSYMIADYGQRVSKGLQLLKDNVDYAFINLVGLFHSENGLDATEKHKGYQKKFCDNPSFDIHEKECYCCHLPLGIGNTVIAANVVAFNIALKNLAKQFEPYGSDATFGVMYQPFDIDTKAIPYTIQSNIDGFHPNILAHEFFAKLLWNQMFLPRGEKELKAEYDAERPVYCPGENDVFSTS